MQVVDGQIIPGIKIGQFYLGSKKEDMLDKDIIDYSEWIRDDGFSIVSVENAKFWFDVNHVLIQIGVTIGFKGKLKGGIGIGNNMSDIQKEYGGYKKDNSIYAIKDIMGLCFELGDTDDDNFWDDTIAPIEWIFVYKE